MRRLLSATVIAVSLAACALEPSASDEPIGSVGQAVCVKESKRELCWDHIDNNCDGWIDDTCPCTTNADCVAPAVCGSAGTCVRVPRPDYTAARIVGWPAGGLHRSAKVRIANVGDAAGSVWVPIRVETFGCWSSTIPCPTNQVIPNTVQTTYSSTTSWLTTGGYQDVTVSVYNAAVQIAGGWTVVKYSANASGSGAIPIDPAEVNIHNNDSTPQWSFMAE